MTATSEYNAQNAAIVAALQTVAGIGRVHDRPRHGDFRERWQTTIDGIPQIRAWEVAPGETQTNRREQGRRHRYRTWKITGAVGLTDMAAEDTTTPPADVYPDASFHLIERLAYEAADALDADRTLAGSFIDTDPWTVTEPTVITIGGGALCWGVTLEGIGYTILNP